MCLSLAVLFVAFVNDTGSCFVTGNVICRLCQQHRRWVCHWQCYLSSLSTTQAVGLSLAVLFVVFVNNTTASGFVLAVLLSSLSTTPAVGLSLTVLFIVFVNNSSGRFVTGSVICRLCQLTGFCHCSVFRSGFIKSEARFGSRL